MSTPILKHYYEQIEKLVDFGGTRKETSLRNAFYVLLNEYARTKNLIVVPEVSIMGTKGKLVTPDGALKDALRQDLGYWESKDEYDDLHEEIQKKFEKGYPKENILFEDGKTAILYQHGQKVLEVAISDDVALDELLKRFINFEKPEVVEFRDAIEHFKADIPQVTEALRKIIIEQEHSNPAYNEAKERFLEILRESVNPQLSTADVREIVIQHILTADIFNTIFDEVQFHRENNIAKQLEQVVDTFFTGALRRAT
ncbi:MAG: hypothetical protein N3A69_12450, partial [Leptospiraceae bacterium]|nr:hypothetical protein [Leptospiraceae bacterium]